MKQLKILSIFILLFMFCITLTACDLFSSDTTKYTTKLESITGKWYNQDDESTYFEFDGSRFVMCFTYYEDGIAKYSGEFNVIYRGLGDDVLNPMCIKIFRDDKEKEDWINCYVESFLEDFTQFTVMQVEEDLGMIEGSIHTHIYRISELPYKLGTYILEGNAYKEESNNYLNGDKYYIPSGTYSLETGESFTFLTTKPIGADLFQYKNKDVVVEGLYTIDEEKKNIYLYIYNDPYNKMTKADKEIFNDIVNIYYPNDIILRGDFSNANSITINDLYHNEDSPINVDPSTWVFGTYKNSK